MSQFNEAGSPDVPGDRWTGADGHCQELDGLREGYVLRALDPEEDTVVAGHMASCPTCAREIETLTHTVAQLAFLSPAARPSVAVKAQLLARVAHSVERGAEQMATMDLARTWSYPDLPATTQTIPSSRSTPPTPQPSAYPAARPQRRPLWESLRASMIPVVSTTLPLVMVLALMGNWAMDLRDQKNSAVAERQVLETQFETLGSMVSNGARSYLLTNANGAPVKVVLQYDYQNERGMLMVFNMDGSAVGEYRIMCETKAREMQEAGLLKIDEDGNGAGMFDLPLPLDEYQMVYLVPEGMDSDEEALKRSFSAWITPVAEVQATTTPAESDAVQPTPFSSPTVQ